MPALRARASCSKSSTSAASRGEEIAPELYAQPGMLMFWTTSRSRPGRRQSGCEQMRAQLRPNAYLRLIENRWVTAESRPSSIWNGGIACVDPELRPLLADRQLAGLGRRRRQREARLARRSWPATWDARRTRRCGWSGIAIFQPSPARAARLRGDDRGDAARPACGASTSARSGSIPTRCGRGAAAAARRLPMVEFPQRSRT